MKLARVIGRVVATIKDPGLTGFRLLVVHDLDELGSVRGDPYVAVDGIRCAGPGDVVYVVGKRDAAIALGDKPPVDATIVGFVDQVTAAPAAGGDSKTWKK